MPLEADPQLAALINQIYDATLDENIWLGLAESIARCFGADSTILKTQDQDNKVDLLEMTSNLVVAPKDQAWADYWHRNDIWVQRSMGVGLSEIVASHELVAPADFDKTGFYYDWNRHLGIYHMMGSVFAAEGNSVGVVGIHRDKRGSIFDAREKARLSLFLPHLQRGLKLRHELAKVSLAKSALTAAAERLGTAILVLDGQCRIRYANDVAESLIRTSSEMRVSARRFGLHDRKLESQFSQMVRDAISTASGLPRASRSALMMTRPGRAPLALLVAPLRPDSAEARWSEPAVLLMIRDPEQPGAAPETLRELFGLTRTEAMVASALADGRSLETIAIELRIGIGTARSHLKKIMAKTETNRQAELVALLSRGSIGIHR